MTPPSLPLSLTFPALVQGVAQQVLGIRGGELALQVLKYILHGLAPELAQISFILE